MVGSHELGSLHSWEHVGKKRKRRKNGLCACSNIPYLFQLCFSLRFLCYALVVGLSKAEDTIRLEINSTWHLVENSSLVLGPTLTVNNFNASDTVQLLLNVSAGGFRNRLSPTDSLMTLYFNDTSEYINNALQDWEYVPPLHWNSQLGGEETLSMKAGIAPDWQINESIPIVTWSKNNAPIIHLLNLTIVYGMEDERLILEGVSVEEVDAGEDPSGVMEITLSVEHGTIDILTVGGLWVIYNIKPQYGCGHTLIFRGNVVQVNEALGGLSYMGPENWSGIDKLTIHVNDLGNTGVGGTLTARGNIDVVIQAVNDAPQIQAPFSILDMDEDEVLPIRGITVSDEEELESLFKFQVSVSIHTLGAGGTLKFPPQVEGAQLISGAWFTSSHVEFLALPHAIPALLENLTFTPFPNANELSCGITVIEWTVSDLGCCGSGGQGTDTLILKIRVRAVNDAPTLSIPPYINIQQDELEILPGIEVEDIDARENPSSLIQVNITVENGSLQFLGGLHNNAGLWVKNDGSNGFLQFFGTVYLVKAALQTIAYRGFFGWSGTDHLTVSVDDLGNTGRGGALTVTQKSVINVEKNTRIIVISAPSVLEVEEDGELPLSPLFTTSVLSGEVRVVMLSVEVSNGQLESPFSTTTTTHSGWAALELVIPVSNIGDVLASISYVPCADWNGVDNIRIYMSDKQAGGGVTPLLSSFIHVVPIPDAPNITYLAPDNPLVYTHSNGAIRIEGLSVKDADAKNSATAELILLNVTSTSGLGVPRFRRGLHVYGLSFPAGGLGLGSSAGGYYNSSLVVTGTYCAINIALQELLYESNSQAQADNDMLEVTVSRSGLSSIVTVSIPLHHSSSPPISIQGAPLITKIPGDNSIRILSDLEISFDMENIDNVLGLAQLHSTSGNISISLPPSTTIGSTLTLIDKETPVSDQLYFQTGAGELQTALREVFYTPPPGWSGVTYINISLALVSPLLSQHLPLNFTMEVLVNTVHYSPTLLAPETFEGLEDEPLLLIGLDILDADTGNSHVELEISIRVSYGELTLGAAAELAQFIHEDRGFVSFRVSSIPQAKLIIGEISYLGGLDWSGEDVLEFNANSTGNEELGSGDAVAAAWTAFTSSKIIIHPINDPPSIMIPTSTIEMFGGQPTPVRNISIKYVDDLVISVKFEAVHGFLSFVLPIPEEISLSKYNNSDKNDSLVLDGQITVLNQLLESLVYSSSREFLGIDWIHISAINGKRTPQGGDDGFENEPEQHSIRVLVHGRNDPPIISFESISLQGQSSIIVTRDEAVTFGDWLEIYYHEPALPYEKTFLTLNVSAMHGSVAFPHNVIISGLHDLSRDPLNAMKEVEGGWWAALGPLSSLTDAKNFLIYYGAAGWSGNDTITACLTTSEGIEAKSTISVVVTPTNDCPIIGKPALPFLHDEPVALYSLELSVSDIDGDVLQMNVSTTLGGGSLLFEGQLPSNLYNSATLANMGHTLVMDGKPEVIKEMLKNISFIPDEDFNGLEIILFTAIDQNFAIAEPREVMIYIEAVNDPPERVQSPDHIIAHIGEWTSILPLEVFDSDENDPSCQVPLLTVTLNAINANITLGEAAHPGIVVIPVSNSSHIVFQGQSTWINQALLSLKVQPTTDEKQDMEMTTAAFVSGKLEDDGSCGRGGVLHTVSVWPIDVQQEVSTPPIVTVLAALSNENQLAATDDFNEGGWAILALNEDVPVRLPGIKLSSGSAADRLLYVDMLATNGALSFNFTAFNAEPCIVNTTVDTSGKWIRLVGLLDDLNCVLEDGGGVLFEPSSFGLWQTFSDIYVSSTMVLAPSDPRLCRVDITVTEEVETSQLLPTTTSVSIHISVLDNNHAPTIDALTAITAVFSQPLTIPGIQVNDSDMTSEGCEDGVLEVTIEAIHGNVHVPSDACIQYGVEDLYNDQNQVHLVASLNRMNSVLESVVYNTAGAGFDGTTLEDTIYFTVSDKEFCGEGGVKSNSTTISVSISQQPNDFFISSEVDGEIKHDKWPLLVEMDEDTEVYLPWDGMISRQGDNSVTSDVEIYTQHGHVLLGPGHESLVVRDDVQWISYIITTAKNLSHEEFLTSDIMTDEVQHVELQTGWSYEVQQVDVTAPEGPVEVVELSMSLHLGNSAGNDTVVEVSLGNAAESSDNLKRALESFNGVGEVRVQRVEEPQNGVRFRHIITFLSAGGNIPLISVQGSEILPLGGNVSVSEIVPGSMQSQVQQIQLTTGENGGILQEGSILFALGGAVANVTTPFNALSADIAEVIGNILSSYPGAITVSRTDLSGDNSTRLMWDVTFAAVKGNMEMIQVILPDMDDCVGCVAFTEGLSTSVKVVEVNSGSKPPDELEFTLTLDGPTWIGAQTTTTLPMMASTAQVKDALESLPGLERVTVNRFRPNALEQQQPSIGLSLTFHGDMGNLPPIRSSHPYITTRTIVDGSSTSVSGIFKLAVFTEGKAKIQTSWLSVASSADEVKHAIFVAVGT